MAQTGYTPISIYYSATASNTPTAGNLVAGELAINTADGKLFYKDSSGVVQTIATKANTSGTYNSITTNQLTIGTTQLGAGNASIMKNRIINGAMVIDQRNAGASVTVTANGQYTLDRWTAVSSVSSKFSVQQNAGAINPPAGFSKYLGVTSLSAYTVGASEAFGIAQKIEGYNTADLGFGTASAKSVTISAWVYSSLTGTFGGVLTNGAQNRSYPFTYYIPVANTWTQISVTIAGDTTGTWATDNSTSLFVNFNLGCGSTYIGTAGAWAATAYLTATGTTSVVGTNGATFYITGVQLEVGSSATGFEYRQYQQELALCQRYYWRNNAGTAFTSFGSGVIESSTNFGTYIKLPVTMRAVPTPNYSNLRGFDGFNATAVSSFSNNYSSTDTLNPYITASGAIFIVGRGAVLQANGTTSAWIDATAEL